MAQVDEPVTGIIVAGGRSSRFGRNKALALWKGKPLLWHMVEILKPFCQVRLVVAKDPRDYESLSLDARLISDTVDLRHPLAGLLAGIEASTTRQNFVCACDMPRLLSPLIQGLLAWPEDVAVVVPEWGGKIQPLCGRYNRSALKSIRNLLEVGGNCVDLYSRIPSRIVAESQVARWDPSGLSFDDVDTPEDFLRLEKEEVSGAH